MKAKKWLAAVLAVALSASMAACGGSTTTSSTGGAAASTGDTESAAASATSTGSGSVSFAGKKVMMVTDTGGVNDQSFNQSSWEGLQNLNKDTGAEVSYAESKQESDYATNLDKGVDGGNQLIWGVGFAMADAVKTAAQQNPDVKYAIIDNAYDDTPSNLTAVVFRSQEQSFLVGYIAARTTKTNKVGFVGGIPSDTISQFEFGYKAGVAYGAKELNKTIDVVSQYAQSFNDSAKGKAIANSMFSGGCDIVFHAAGGVGTGVIEAAKESGKYAIGVDRDQAYLAPDNVLTSALKLCNTAVYDVSKRILSGEDLGGQTISLGLSEGGVGIPTEHKLMGDDTYNATIQLEQKIKDKEIVPPANENDYNTYVQSLK